MEKMPGYKIIVSDRARQMLAAHVRFLAEKSPECDANVAFDRSRFAPPA
jgi:hypothetical protein